MVRSQVTLDIAQDLLSHSLFVRLILWSAVAGRNRVLLTSKISIALAIHSLDLRWSAGIWTCRVLLTLKISIALAIHSLDPLDRGKGLRLERVAC